jgi:hypothetical protein
MVFGIKFDKKDKKKDGKDNDENSTNQEKQDEKKNEQNQKVNETKKNEHKEENKAGAEINANVKAKSGSHENKGIMGDLNFKLPKLKIGGKKKDKNKNESKENEHEKDEKSTQKDDTSTQIDNDDDNDNEDKNISGTANINVPHVDAKINVPHVDTKINVPQLNAKIDVQHVDVPHVDAKIDAPHPLPHHVDVPHVDVSTGSLENKPKDDVDISLNTSIGASVPSIEIDINRKPKDDKHEHKHGEIDIDINANLPKPSGPSIEIDKKHKDHGDSDDDDKKKKKKDSGFGIKIPGIGGHKDKDDKEKHKHGGPAIDIDIDINANANANLPKPSGPHVDAKIDVPSISIDGKPKDDIDINANTNLPKPSDASVVSVDAVLFPVPFDVASPLLDARPKDDLSFFSSPHSDDKILDTPQDTSPSFVSRVSNFFSLSDTFSVVPSSKSQLSSLDMSSPSSVPHDDISVRSPLVPTVLIASDVNSSSLAPLPVVPFDSSLHSISLDQTSQIHKPKEEKSLKSAKKDLDSDSGFGMKFLSLFGVVDDEKPIRKDRKKHADSSRERHERDILIHPSVNIDLVSVDVHVPPSHFSGPIVDSKVDVPSTSFDPSIKDHKHKDHHDREDEESNKNKKVVDHEDKHKHGAIDIGFEVGVDSNLSNPSGRSVNSNAKLPLIFLDAKPIDDKEKQKHGGPGIDIDIDVNANSILPKSSGPSAPHVDGKFDASASANLSTTLPSVSLESKSKDSENKDNDKKKKDDKKKEKRCWIFLHLWFR